MAALRDATEVDLARILEITNHAIAHTTAIWSLAPTTLDERTAWFRGRRERGFPVVVAVDAERVVGFASYGEFRPREGYRHSVEHSLYVDAELRGRGIGAMLLANVVERARAAGLHAMIGAIDAENAVSIRLHERHGFRVVGRLPEVGRKFDRWLDLVFMQRMLG